MQEGADDFFIVAWFPEDGGVTHVLRASSLDMPEIKERMDQIVTYDVPTDVIVVEVKKGTVVGVADDTPN